MSTEGMIATLVLLVVALAWILLPLLRRGGGLSAAGTRLQKQHDRLDVVYERILTNIRDLDEDFATGKINEDDYEYEREDWAQRGIHVLKALDNLETAPVQPEPAGEVADDSDAAIDEAIEAAIEAHRKKRV
jgi:hypothetical protein